MRLYFDELSTDILIHKDDFVRRYVSRRALLIREEKAEPTRRLISWGIYNL